MIRGLQDWLNKGHLELQSAAASNIFAVLYRLETAAPCPLIIAPLPQDFFDNADIRGTRVRDPRLATSSRLYELVLPWALTQWGDCFARVPW